MIGPPIQLDPAFVASPDALLEWLRSAVAWDERMRARKTASFGVPYDYSQMAYEAVPIPTASSNPLRAIVGAVSRKIRRALMRVSLSHYPAVHRGG